MSSEKSDFFLMCIMKEFGNRLRELRTERKLLQKELAKILKTTHYSISDWETAKCEPDFQTICLIADHFKVSIDYLFGREH